MTTSVGWNWKHMSTWDAAHAISVVGMWRADCGSCIKILSRQTLRDACLGRDAKSRASLFTVERTPMAEIVESWKKYTAQKVNRSLNRRGRFWEADYWDTYM